MCIAELSEEGIAERMARETQGNASRTGERTKKCKREHIENARCNGRGNVWWSTQLMQRKRICKREPIRNPLEKNDWDM